MRRVAHVVFGLDFCAFVHTNITILSIRVSTQTALEILLKHYIPDSTIPWFGHARVARAVPSFCRVLNPHHNTTTLSVTTNNGGSPS